MSFEDKITAYLTGQILESKHDAKVMAHHISEICSDYFKECMKFEKENQELREENIRSIIRKAEIIEGLLEQITELKKRDVRCGV